MRAETVLSVLLLLASPAFARGLEQRPPNASCVAPPRPGGALEIELVPFFPGASVGLAVAVAQSPLDSNVWYAAELDGVVRRLRSDLGLSTEALDLRDRLVSAEEGGLLGLALHPNFASNGALYVFYTGSSQGASLASVVARFTSSDGGSSFDPASEEVILSVDQFSGIHKGGDIHFGPDGFLYIGLGDDGDSAAAQDPAQLRGSFLRIDVDRGTPYAIPPDNPFADGGPGAREVWAWGFRNPFRWSFDRETGELWAADVGQSAWEEIDLVARGQNHGWPIREGAHCYATDPCDESGLSEPVVEYSHEDGCAVIGGHVYRGTALPALRGALLYSDFCSSRIWAALPETDAVRPVVELVTSPTTIFGFGQGADGEVLVLREDGIFRIAAAAGQTSSLFPQRLSETGCVDPADPSRPAAGLIPFDVIEPLWSDGADKQRWLALPDAARIHVAPDGDFQLPIGSVTMKHFSLGERLVETRLFVRHDDGGWAGYSYEWNDEQTEAVLLPDGKQREVNGQVWTFPSRAQCMSCHTQAAGFSLGLEVLQLNRPFRYPATGLHDNQLEVFAHIGLLDAPLSAPSRELPSLSRSTLDAAARSYLHANCAGCHRAHGTAPSPELSYSIASPDLAVCDQIPSYGDVGIPGARLLVPGDPSLSLLSVRPRLTGPGQMPPLARTLVHAYGTQVIDDWIESWGSCAGPDGDRDGIADASDNCATAANPDQADANGNDIGDACEWVCNDGIDNDGDGKLDYPADPGCRARDSALEDPECNDGVDNDQDGQTDSPSDASCAAPWGTAERDLCGLGPELAFVGVLLVAIRRRLSRAPRSPAHGRRR